LSADPDSSVPPPHVLVVDDEAILVEEIAEFLTDEEFVVATAFDGVEALKRFRAASPGTFTVILTDLRMPGLDGYELTAAIRAQETDDAALEIVLVTGHGTLENPAERAQSGIFQFVRKPVRLVELSAILRRAHDAALTRRGVSRLPRPEPASE
jgi:CheY-like chemotaxis protein